MEKKFFTEMRLFLGIIIISLLSTSCAKSTAVKGEPGSDVRVALAHKVSKMTLSSASSAKLSTPSGSMMLKPNDTLFIDFSDNSFSMHLNRDKKIVVKALPIYFIPQGNGVFSYNGMLYRGHLMIRKDADNLLLPINKLLMEDYLKGVVPAEIGKLKKNMIEASKAQAVAARTYAFAHLRKHEDMGYDLECTVQDQVYRGYLLEDSLTNEAIESTKGIVAYYKNSPIDAKYHSTCGGHTSSNEDEWGGPPAPYLRGRFDGEGCLFKKVYCSQSKHYKWSYEYDRDDFYEMVSGNYSLMKKVNVKAANIFVSKQDKYKRIVELTIEDSSGKKYKVRGLDIRRLFTFEEHLGGMLKSRNFALDHKKGKIIINGGGFGHGVGMCQYGAMEMAKSGKNYKQILNHYYKGIQLKRIY